MYFLIISEAISIEFTINDQYTVVTLLETVTGRDISNTDISLNRNCFSKSLR
jgi:hypothetical protein